MSEMIKTESINVDALEIKISSRIIAEETGKLHKDVMRDIRNLIENFNQRKTALVENDQTEIDHSHKIMVDYTFELSEYKDKKGEMRTEYLLTKKQLLLLVSGYDVILRARIIDRLEELEKHQLELQFSNYNKNNKTLLEGYQILIDDNKELKRDVKSYIERNWDLSSKVSELQKKADVFDKIRACIPSDLIFNFKYNLNLDEDKLNKRK